MFEIVTVCGVTTGYARKGDVHIGKLSTCHSAYDALEYARNLVATQDNIGRLLYSYVALKVGKYIKQIKSA